MNEAGNKITEILLPHRPRVLNHELLAHNGFGSGLCHAI